MIVFLGIIGISCSDKCPDGRETRKSPIPKGEAIPVPPEPEFYPDYQALVYLLQHQLPDGSWGKPAPTIGYRLIFPHVSLSVTVRLNTNAPAFESITSLMKYPVRSN